MVQLDKCCLSGRAFISDICRMWWKVTFYLMMLASSFWESWHQQTLSREHGDVLDLAPLWAGGQRLWVLGEVGRGAICHQFRFSLTPVHVYMLPKTLLPPRSNLLLQTLARVNRGAPSRVYCSCSCSQVKCFIGTIKAVSVCLQLHINVMEWLLHIYTVRFIYCAGYMSAVSYSGET